MNRHIFSENEIYSISRKVVEEHLPEEITLFDTIWGVMKEHLAQWEDKIPDSLLSEEYQKGLKKELGFLDEAEVSEINTPRVIALISLAWIRLMEFKGQVHDADIEETIAKYGKSLPEWLRLKTIKLAVPMIKEDLKKTGRIPFLPDEEVKKYVIYSYDAKTGKSISENELEKRELEKQEYIIWMDAAKRVVLVKGKEVKIDTTSLVFNGLSDKGSRSCCSLSRII